MILQFFHMDYKKRDVCEFLQIRKGKFVYANRQMLLLRNQGILISIIPLLHYPIIVSTQKHSV